ncbi:class I SAM-dependent methyltransferase [Fictibacillus sp. WQ 8-8]|uniref:class I SAM-dependent methyltransferase n=1 Tax=Fictibacillus sp. WQ 8-8 TaxID=2938788 RepID=UPI0021093907|nr:class I SAM-dependent methyltransferase [Fictibacillus sp. WQ 8-8]MCQ6264662.1 class I SAM-dependent methyltransferase [Fictibacillus sp. WQ 8-8]
MKESLYDQMNKWDKDDDFFVQLVKKIRPTYIADLGCGTGRIALYLGEEGYEILGIDPDPNAIETAKQKDKKLLVEWKIGTSEELMDASFDLVMMTSNVAQVFLKDIDWNKTLLDIYNSLNNGGYLIFDTRNPLQRAWEQWTKEKTKKFIQDPITGNPMMVWHEFLEINESVVKYKTVYQNENLQNNVEESALIFRTKEQIGNDLTKAGFIDIKVYGDWGFDEAIENVNSFIFTAKKR